MRFNIATLFALTAITQVAIAAPAPAPVAEPVPAPTLPAWNDKGPEAGYKFGAIACAGGAYLCNRLGHTVGQDVLASGAYCCSTAAAAVTASQSPGWVAAWQASAAGLGIAARVIGGIAVGTGKWVAHCTVNVCTMIANAAAGGAPPTTRSLTIDGSPAALEDKHLAARFAQPEMDAQEDAVLLPRLSFDLN